MAQRGHYFKLIAKVFYMAARRTNNSTKRIKLKKPIVDALRDMEKRFIDIYRRSPAEGDPVFFDQLLASPEDFQDELMEVMNAVGTSPELKYAIEKTGRIVTADNMKYLCSDEIDEWNNAIEEYRELDKQGYFNPPTTRFDSAILKLQEEFLRLPHVIALFIRQAYGHSRKRNMNRDIAFFYLTRSLKTLRACGALNEFYFTEDAMTLARSILENYLQLVYLVVDPTAHAAWAEAQIGLRVGLYEYKKSANGKLIYNQIVDKTTGKIVPVISRAVMAAKSPFTSDRDIYTLLYAEMSSFAHPDPYLIDRYFSTRGFDIAIRTNNSAGYLFGNLLTAFTLDAVVRLGNHPRRSRRDASVLLTHIRRRAVRVFESMPEHSPITNALGERIKKIGEKWI
jgi:hypothetical protein